MTASAAGRDECGLLFVFHLPILAIVGWCVWSVYLTETFGPLADPLGVLLLANIVAFAFLSAIPVTLVTFGLSPFIFGAALRIYIERRSLAFAILLLAAVLVSAPLSFL